MMQLHLAIELRLNGKQVKHGKSEKVALSNPHLVRVFTQIFKQALNFVNTRVTESTRLEITKPSVTNLVIYCYLWQWYG
ncbi:MAG: hypothetical protein WBC07_08435 [Methylotenera sp.]